MQENFDKDLVRFDRVLADMKGKKKQIGKTKVTYNFVDTLHKDNSRQKVKECLIALEKYKTDTIKLAKDDSVNKEYYQAHFRDFMIMLDQINDSDALDLKDDDYKLIVPQDFTYQKPKLEICKDMFLSTGFGIVFGPVVTLLTYAIVLLGLATWIAFSITFPPALVGTGPLLFYVMPLVVASVGAFLGAVIGANYGYHKKSSYQVNLDLSNSDLLNLLQEAYVELNKVSAVKDAYEESSDKLELSSGSYSN